MRAAKNFFGNSRHLFYLLLSLLIVYTIVRVIFLGCNKDVIGIQGFYETIEVIYSGLQQDITSILLLNIPIIFLVFLYEYVKAGTIYLLLVRWLFMFINSAGVALNVIDIGYFRFVKHRMNLELAFIIKDSLGSYKSIMSGFWIFFCLFIAFIWILLKISLLVLRLRPIRSSFLTTLTKHAFLVLCFLLLARGFKERMITPYTPLIIVEPTLLPAAQNSILSLAYSLLKKQQELRPYYFLPENEASKLIPTSYYIGKPNRSFEKKNVVIFILESFSKPYLLPGHPYKAKTPFLDSLIRKSIFFPNAFANNYTSTQGIVPILGSLPTLLDEPFFYSSYANLKIQGIGNALKKKRYNTNFFMGADDDHFGFGKFSKMVGIDHYYDRNDFKAYSNSEETVYDGNWGIFDAPFFNYSAEVLTRKQQPFLAVIFNLSSHYPFTVPKELKKRFDDPQQLPSQRAINYVDFALQDFFRKATKTSWFQNTVFLFCADHWFPPDLNKFVYSYVNASQISFFIYDPSVQNGSVNKNVISQLDVVPTILDYINYQDIYYGFGRSAFDSIPFRFVINKYQQYFFQSITENYVLGVDPNSFQTKYLFRYKGDSVISQNLKDEDSLKLFQQKNELYIKAYLQQHNKVLLNRKF